MNFFAFTNIWQKPLAATSPLGTELRAHEIISVSSKNQREKNPGDTPHQTNIVIKKSNFEHIDILVAEGLRGGKSANGSPHSATRLFSEKRWFFLPSLAISIFQRASANGLNDSLGPSVEGNRNCGHFTPKRPHFISLSTGCRAPTKQ